MFLDEITITAHGGRGGEGCVHFARRKFQPFGGPDGGDGGAGGNVVLRGTRDVDTLYHLRHATACGGNGAPGGPNLMIGAAGEDCALEVPLGTLVYEARSGMELGSVTRAGEGIVLAQGGKGGRGNTQFATGRRRSPKTAQPGAEGKAVEALLRYRIYADTVLIELLGAAGAPFETVGVLLPLVLERPLADLDLELYRRKPRWLRIEHGYQRFDCAYVPLLWDARSGELDGMLAHCYWALSVTVNLLPLGEGSMACWRALHARLEELPWRRLARLACVLPRSCGAMSGEPARIGSMPVEYVSAAASEDGLRVLRERLQGGTVG
jgi:hypothetical protein